MGPAMRPLRHAHRFALIALVIGAGPAKAQDPMQLCVNQCMFHAGPAGSASYNTCIRQMCEAAAPQAQRPAAPAPAAAGWTVQSTRGGSGHSAAVEAGGRSFNVICQRGGQALIGVAGMGVAPQGVGLRIDRQDYGLSFVAQNDILYTEATPHLLRALMAGSQVEVTGRSGAGAVFPLRGSSAAIRQAMSNCGLRP